MQQPIEAECVKVEEKKVPPDEFWLVRRLSRGFWETWSHEQSLAAAQDEAAIRIPAHIFHCTDQPREPKPLPTKEEIEERWSSRDPFKLDDLADFVLSEIKRWRDQC